MVEVSPQIYHDENRRHAWQCPTPRYHALTTTTSLRRRKAHFSPLARDAVSQEEPPGGCHTNLQVLIIVTDGHILRLLQLLLVLGDQGSVDLNLRGLGELANELQVRLVGKSTRQPQEGLLEVVVAPGAKIVVLQVPLPVELNVLGLD